MDHVCHKIRPLVGQSSSSTTIPRTGSKTSRSDPSRTGGDDEKADFSGKRRKVPESITQNACLKCKKARTKCDGQKPCKRCASRTGVSECVYEAHVKQAKEDLVKQLEHYKAKDRVATRLFHALRTNDNVAGIFERLRNNESYETIVRCPRQPALEDEAMTLPESQDSDHETRAEHPEGLNWTSVTADPIVLDHLLKLFFAWTHPVHTLFSESHFTDSYLGKSEGHCSSVLVNALCAMGCQIYSMDGDEYHNAQLSDGFRGVANASIDPEDTQVTTIQAIAVMFLVYAARGNSLKASAYLKIAVSKASQCLEQDREGAPEVWKNTIRGIRNLSIEWAQMTFRIPSTISLPIFDINDLNEKSLDKSLWHHYRFVGDRCPTRPSLLATTNREKTKLLEIIHSSMNLMYAPEGTEITAQQVLRLYRTFIYWRNDLPSSICNFRNDGTHVLPHVLSLLILYTNSVVQLLRPLLSLEGFPAFLVERVIWKHAQEGLALWEGAYRAQFTCNYQQVMQLFSILHLTDVIARHSPGEVDGGRDGSDAIQFAIIALEESMASFAIAKVLRGMLQRTSIECQMHAPDNPTGHGFRLNSSAKNYGIDDLVAPCTGPTYIQPVEKICNPYMTSFAAEWVANSAAFGFAQPNSGHNERNDLITEDLGTRSLMQIRTLLNN